jgi:hypothetical protein
MNMQYNRNVPRAAVGRLRLGNCQSAPFKKTPRVKRFVESGICYKNYFSVFLMLRVVVLVQAAPGLSSFKSHGQDTSKAKFHRT